MIKEDIKINSTRSTIDYKKINNEKIVLDYVTISLASNCSDPLSKVYYFNNKTNSAFTLNSSKNSFIIPTKQSETIIRLYVKNEDYTEEAESVWLKINK